ncbi:type I-B CRISPR-associated protein Cas5b [Clostridium sp. DJ247]|uniref:type I-B CRISPR-associated protein Cas5b n=1 Tax=Clostridium sp. DJ247 TaxID=2726188 RepID=UPI0016292F51|nr:type I-B CRISPR-associated protein Cas5b [Clostridium sp. DJ247]MBC2580023.1 type I-B CRISPR-associated protein Cas5 [Clostridium sp. DJ247]
METIRFKLSGRTAFFKKPDVNTYYYFTYGNIHKVALLGIMGSVMGLSGYNKQSENIKKQVYPDFYEKLKNAKVAIITCNKQGYITKKIQTFNNSVGYANLEQGGNLIIKEQWLQDPQWLVYVKLDETTEEFAELLDNNKAKFIPYLGKNDHFADITNVKRVALESVKDVKNIDSLFKTKDFQLQSYIDDDENFIPWKYQEYLPTGLDEQLNQYIFDDFTETSIPVEKNNNVEIYRDSELNKNIYLF